MVEEIIEKWSVETQKEKTCQGGPITLEDYKSPIISVDPTIPEMLATLN